ncbi:excalibur calcium-binding domain-containing protein [Sabulicella glaciei]|uniref:excalibur calcium-binding domain-containing protein n=1 Tax=Sabulicella glaciei TaxID=2984948 RepID=UPI0034A027BB
MPLPLFLTVVFGVAVFAPKAIHHPPATAAYFTSAVWGLYFPNCAAAHEAGYYNIPVGSPGYRPPLDADGDGLACEPYSVRGSPGRQR